MCPPAAAVARLTGVHFSFSIPAGMIVLALPAGIWHRVPAGRCRCSPCRRAFFVLYPRRYGRLAAGSEEFTTVCPPAVAVVRHAGVHFSFSIPAGMVVLALAAVNLAPCARWSLPLFASPACIFYPVSPPVWSSRRWRRKIWHRVPAGRCHCSPCRRAFFIPFPCRYGRLAAGGEEFTTVCPLATAVVRLTGVHFSFCIPAGMVVFALAAENLVPCARWSLPLFASPACIFHPISPPSSLSRRWRR